MLKVFIIMENDGNDRYIIAVRSDRESAETLIDSIKERRKRKYSYLSFSYEEWDVDDPEDVKRMNL